MNDLNLTQDRLKTAALEYHAKPKPGKIATQLTKSNQTQQDLSLAYTPGVASPVLAIAEHPEQAYQYTAKGNLVGIITDGSAVLGLGNQGPLASKPVMEGKLVLFKRFANIDGFDIEISAKTPEEFIQTVINIAPTFGGINLEDIKAPECFLIEEKLKSELEIPVFHDDQHGTAITVAAGLLNALELQEKTLSSVNIVFLGVGAAGIASAKLLIKLGADPERIYMIDRKGVVSKDRHDLNTYKAELAIDTPKRTLSEAMEKADVFIGLSGPDLLPADLLPRMAPRPILFALSNPNPEINPKLAKDIRPDLLLATGRSDYPNQINNILCFPYIFRGALDARANAITEAMKIAAVHAISELAKEPVPDTVLSAYANASQLSFGPEYILPKPIDPRLLQKVAKAVKEAAIA